MFDNLVLRSGVALPRIGFGTWRLGESRATEAAEIATLLHALDVGFTHFDTAEMYGDGGAELLLGDVLRQRPRDGLFITSKVYPWNAGTADIVQACENSLGRLGVDHLDLYLLHWPGSVPFEETLAGAEKLLADGKIRAFGISNFDARGLSNIISAGLDGLVDVNQVMYNPARRGIEFDLLPLMQANGIGCVAYTPIEPQRLSADAAFAALAGETGLTPAGLALAWHMTRGIAVPIPKASTIEHVDELRAAADVRLDTAQMDAVDRIFPPPASARPLDIV